MHYEADRSLMGDGYDLCGHSHGKPDAARRCLPRVPTGPGNERAYSRARIYEITDQGDQHPVYYDAESDSWTR